MNKRILKALAILASLAFASTAFAADTISSTTSIGGLAFTPSSNVSVKVDSGTAEGYSAVSGHASGNRYFGTDSSKSIIYWLDAGGSVGVAGVNNQTVTKPTALGEPAQAPAFASDWHSL